VFNLLANRGFGLPQQELAFSKQKPFRLEVTVLGSNEPPRIMESVGAGELPKTPAENGRELAAERLLGSGSASTPEDSEESPDT
jgi:hypothetical protein